MHLSRKILAGALIALLPVGSLFACNLTAWTGSVGAPVAGDPTTRDGDTDFTPRYSGSCALKSAAAGSSYVFHDMAGGEGVATPYRARLYVYTGNSATTEVLRATDTVGAAGTSVLTVSYNPGAGQFTFTAPGVTPAPIGSIQANKWYMVEINYQQGQPFEAFVRGAGSPTEATISTGATSTGTVRSVAVGHVSAGGGSGNIIVDDFDSSRGATRINGFLRGDSSLDNKCDANDAINIVDDFFKIQADLPGVLVSGPTDCQEDGLVDANDAICLVNRFFAEAATNFTVPCGGQ